MNRITCTLAALGLSLVAASAQAMLMHTQTESFPNSTSLSFVFDGFDSTLGTLTGVDFMIEGDANIRSGMITGDTDSGQFDVQIDAVIEVIGGGGIGSFENLPGPVATCTGQDSCTASYDSASADFFLSDSAGTSGLSDYIDQDVKFDFFIDNDVDEFDGTATNGPTTDWRASGMVTLKYTYDPAVDVPAPATLTLLGLGLAGLGWSRRKKNA